MTHPAPECQYTLSIHGMTCAACAARIERLFKRLPDVESATVSLANERAQVQFSQPHSAQILLDTLQKAGFSGAVFHAEQPRGLPAEGSSAPAVWPVLAALFLAFPLVFNMIAMWLGWPWMLPAWLQCALATPVQGVFGARFYRAAWQAFKTGGSNMDQLVVLGTTAGYGVSLYLWWQAPPDAMPHLYFESSAVVIALVLLGKYLEARARRQTGEALRALEALRPTLATRWQSGEERRIPIQAVQTGDCLRVRPGERIPVDGLVLEGESQADEALISGESLPVMKAPGASVTGGTLNGDGVLLIRATAVGRGSVLSRIIDAVEHAQAAKPPVQRLVDRISQFFVPTVVALALCTGIGWWWADAALETALLNAVSVLVIACPCALGLATPAAIMAGTGVAARHGILIRDAAVLERAPRVTQVAFDKTGTLTSGQPQVTQCFAADGNTDSLLQTAGALQQGSEHPLARAVLQACQARGVSVVAATHVRALPGCGIEGQVDGQSVLLASTRYLDTLGVNRHAFDAISTDWQAQGYSISWLLDTSATPFIKGVLAFGDALHPGAVQAVVALKARAVRVSVLSGDNAGSVARVARAVNADEQHAEQLPADKLAMINVWRAQGVVVAMVGDGLNDAPALAAADVGIAMGSGTDVAMHTAAITLLRSDPRLVSAALDICQRTLRRIRQNLFWAFAYNVIGIPLAAFGLLNPMVAGAAMALSSVCVVGNALLLRYWRPF